MVVCLWSASKIETGSRDVELDVSDVDNLLNELFL